MGDHLNLDINPENKKVGVSASSGNVGSLDFLSDRSDKSDKSPVSRPEQVTPNLSVVDTMGTNLLTSGTGGPNNTGPKPEVNMFSNAKPETPKPMEDNFMMNTASNEGTNEFKPIHRMSPTEIKNEKIDYIYKFK